MSIIMPFNSLEVNIEKELISIWTNINHPLHYASDRVIAAKLGIFLKTVYNKRQKFGVLGAPIRKKMSMKYSDEALNPQADGISKADRIAKELRKIAFYRHKKRISRLKERV